MSAQTHYGSWNNHNGGSTVIVEDSVAEVLGEFAGDYDIPALVAAYRALIDAALPLEISLCGNEFYGPYPVRPDAAEVIPDAIESVDLAALATLFDRERGDLVHVYEDNGGSVYLSAGNSYAWPLGPVTPNMHGRAEQDARTWFAGEWKPSDDLTPENVEDCELIAMWSATAGLTIEREANGLPVAGAGGCAYLGIELP